MRTRLIAPAVALAAAAGTAVPALAVPSAEPGRALTPATLVGSAPEAAPGVYRMTLPADETKRYVEVTRPAGQNLAVSMLTAEKELGSGGQGMPGFSAELRVGETVCSSQSDSVSSYPSATGMAGFVIGVDATTPDRTNTSAAECRSATRYVLEVDRSPEGAKTPATVWMKVTHEPKISGAAPPSAVTGAGATALKTLPREGSAQVAAGSDLAHAAEVTSGTGYPLPMTIGQRYVYKVRVGNGQRLGASLQAPENGKAYEVPSGTSIALTLYSPQWVQVGSFSTSVYGKDPQTVDAFTAPVSWGNRTVTSGASTDIDTSAATWTTTPGWYYVVAAATASSSSSTSTAPPGKGPIPARLTVQVTGTASKAPTYVGASGQALETPPQGELSGASSLVDSEQPAEESSPWVRVGVGAGAVLLAAGAMAWALRRRRRA